MWGKSCMEYGNAPWFRNVSLIINHVNECTNGHVDRCFFLVVKPMIATEVTRATKSWYDELYKPGYNFNNPGWNENPGAGHFTQVVWKGTTELGIGIAQVGFHIFPWFNVRLAKLALQVVYYIPFGWRAVSWKPNKQGSDYYVVGRYRSGTVPLWALTRLVIVKT